MIIEDGIISPRRYRPEEKTWFRPWYCTWGDQMLLSRAKLQQDVSQERKYQTVKQILTEDWVVKTARFIREKKLNIGTIIIDDGWQDYRGDWNLVRKRFPHFREMVDYLHRLNFQVVLWWAPFLLEKKAINWKEAKLTSGPDPYGEKVMDYSLPETRKWLKEKIRLWFGSGPNGWNIDGLKLDFFVEKVTPSTQRGDDSWRGEECCLHQLVKTIYQQASEYHPCPGILAAPHCPSLLPYLVSVFLEERFDANFEILKDKPEMVASWLPGLAFSPHFTYNPAAIPDYLQFCQQTKAIPQIGVVHGTPHDYFFWRPEESKTGTKIVSLASLRRLLAHFS
ncbi:MAG: hypothetical protein NC823_01310, partial [Candidatus Omnitrophica bacterium]|nr:hypothetical protein [Candidatus Omnitrophota bacterium]